MRTKLCWICGEPVPQSAVGRSNPFYLEVRMISVNRPYSTNEKSGTVVVCDKCAEKKVGINREGKNLNK